MAIPPWAVDVLRRGVGGVIDKMPPETIEQLKKKAGDLLAELPQTAAKSVDSVIRGAKMGKDSLKRWSRRHVALITPVVNGSGCLASGQIAGVPLAGEAIEVAVEAFQSGAMTSAEAQNRLDRRLQKCFLSRPIGSVNLGAGEIGILVTSTIDGAFLAIAHANRRLPIYVHRSQSQRLPSGSPLPDALSAGMVDATNRVHEVGSADRVDESDTRGIPDQAILVAVESGLGTAPWFHSVCQSWPAQTDLTRVIWVPAATITLSNPSTTNALAPALPSVFEMLGTSADLLVTPGDGAMGGPRCGLIIGDRKRLDAISSSTVWPAVAADVSVRAAMTITLELLLANDIESVPVQSMLFTSEENLKSRAERLATRLAAEPSVRTCEVTSHPATLASGGKWAIASRQLKLTHQTMSASDWAKKLGSDVPAVIVAVQDDAILVDLRWIQPVDDVALVSTLVGHEEPSLQEVPPT